jgi:hypothetical protein
MPTWHWNRCPRGTGINAHDDSGIAAHDEPEWVPTMRRNMQDADALLWESDSERQMTTIGHLCRESIQEFASSLVAQYQPPGVDPNKAHDVARIRAVIDFESNHLGAREKQYLTALISYWRAISGLIQRQEHGSHQTDRPLVWEDGRRVVFQTAILMFEVESSLSKTASTRN